MRTSLEALEKLCNNCGWRNGCSYKTLCNEYCEEYKLIKKDLELLNSLKKYAVVLRGELYVMEEYNDKNRDDYKYMFLTANEALEKAELLNSI